MIKGSILQEDMTFISMHTSHNRDSKYLSQILIELQEGTDEPTIIIEDLNTLLQERGRFNRQKSSKDILELNNIIN